MRAPRKIVLVMFILAMGSVTLVLGPPAVAVGGDLDPDFGSDGRVTTGFGGESPAYAVAIQGDGKIVAAGIAFYRLAGTRGSRFALARYLPDGSLDPTFGGDGRVRTRFTGGQSSAFAIVVQADGKVVAAGNAVDPTTGKGTFALARYRTNGTLDATFGGDGRVTTGYPGTGAQVFGLTSQTDGKVVAAGSTFARTGTRFALARYCSNGTLDPTFGGDGRVTTAFTGDVQAHGVAIQTDGKVVAAGGPYDPGASDGRFSLARYRPNGTLDATFGADGRVTTAFAGGHAIARAIAIGAVGKVVAAGVPFERTIGSRFALARYRSDGALDPTFGVDGRVTTAFTGDAGAFAVAIQGDGEIVAAGQQFDPTTGIQRFALARYVAR
jgi:uncharacterized delta-60 repeat protein